MRLSLPTIKPRRKFSDPVVLKHIDWERFGCAAVEVCDAETGEFIFTDTVTGTADWLDDRGYKWAGAPGVWAIMEPIL